MQMKPYPLGAHRESTGIRFSYVTDSENSGVILFERSTGKKLKKLPFFKEEKIGNIYCKYVPDVDAEKISYQFYEDNEIIADEHARAFVGKFNYGRARQEKDLKAIFPTNVFDWEGDENPRLPYENCVVYCMHVRGFTKHLSSGVTHKGTFLGISEKLAYLKGIGVTTIELQPAYEFFELPTGQEIKAKQNDMYSGMNVVQDADKKLNYWGYKKGFYYTPKSGYAASDNAQTEFKNMVKEFHKNGMEVVMQFYFPKEVFVGEIPEILRFWILEYHVDGFHLKGENIPMDMIATDPLLSGTKIWYQQFDIQSVCKNECNRRLGNLAEYRDDYLYTMRKFLKGDEDMLGSVLYQMRHIPHKNGRIHYMTNYDGLTLKDMVSYDYKHNEANGELNRDGNNYNCSWNCGEEGNTRKKTIAGLRIRQIKNAMCMLAFSQSTPLIFMGDEFGNSQQGNNNPYCQDNETTWLNWKDLEKNQEIHQFWKELMKLRKEHSILHPPGELKVMDYIGCGYPDLSYHGELAWQPQLENHIRHIGMMFCGKYASTAIAKEDDFLYLGMNMYWEAHTLALPKLPVGLQWRIIFTTGEKTSAFVGKYGIKVQPRSIVLLKSEAE